MGRRLLYGMRTARHLGVISMTEKTYIERKTALAIIDNYAKTVTEEGQVVVAAVRDIISTICTSADVAPVKHGHWEVGYFHDRVCSCCLHPDNDLSDYAHSFCPNCGAKMDEEAKNDT